MRISLLIPAGLVVAMAIGGGVTAHAAADRQASFTAAADRLRAEWTSDEQQGVPAAGLASLRARLSADSPAAPWWSPDWFGNDGMALVSRLHDATTTVWNAALADQRSRAQLVIAQWATFASQQSSWIDGSASAAAARWPQQLAAQSTPAAIGRLAATWQTAITQQRAAVLAAQTAKLNAELQSAGGPQTVLATAQRLVATAGAENLDAGNVAGLATALADQIAADSDATTTAAQLLAAVSRLQGLVNLNNQVAGQLRPLLLTIDQAEAEGTPNAPSFASQMATLDAQMQAARTNDQLDAVQQAVTALQSQVNAELTANQCGHSAVGPGKVITMSLSLQEMLFYQDGCVVQATAVTTGRPQLRTPTGTFQIFYKQSPFTFISPWPPSSPFYYYPSPVSWVMEFAAGGFFIHDAPWESAGAFGPGSEDNLSAASHGCVHTPHSVMEWAYSWTPVGTPVIIAA